MKSMNWERAFILAGVLANAVIVGWNLTAPTGPGAAVAIAIATVASGVLVTCYRIGAAAQRLLRVQQRHVRRQTAVTDVLLARLRQSGEATVRYDVEQGRFVM